MDKQKFLSLIYWKHPDFWNLGDFLSIYVAEALSGRKVVEAKMTDPVTYACIGSIIHQNLPDSAIVWGSGAIASNTMANVNNKFLAVRGPLTYKLLRERGVKNLGRVFGDPALLLPYIVNPVESEVVFELGVIPHYIDYEYVRTLVGDISKNQVKLIDIKSNNPQDFVNQIKACKRIISSSLHGLIIAHAYHVPAIWIEFSPKVVGDGFKFADYFSSVSIPSYRIKAKPEHLRDIDGLSRLVDRYAEFNAINNFDPTELLNSCPFLDHANIPRSMARLISN